HSNAGRFNWSMYDGSEFRSRYVGLKNGSHTWYGATGVQTFSVDNSGNMVVAGDLRVDGGDIGTTSDPDLLQLAPNVLTVNGWVYTAFGPSIAGVVGTTRGYIACHHGSDGNKPGYVTLYSPNGTGWYLFAEDDGTLKIHNDVPTANSDGTVVGSQT